MSSIEFRYCINNLDTFDNHLELNFEMINHYERDLYFSRRGTPFDDHLSDCFIIKHNNQILLKFDGLLVSRKDESDEDIIKIESGKSINKIVKITETYKFIENGNYEIRFKTKNFKFHLESKLIIDDLVYFNNPINITNNVLIFNINAKQLLFNTIGDVYRNIDNTLGQITFSNNATKEQKDILLKITEDLIDFYKNHFKIINDDLYIKWFGLYKGDCLATVIDFYKFTFNRILKRDIHYNIDNNASIYYAITVPRSHQITIFPQFWKRFDKCFYSKFGLLIHEFSHIECSTSDDSNSICESLEFAKIDCELATSAAYNYEFYIEDLLWSPPLLKPCK